MYKFHLLRDEERYEFQCGSAALIENLKAMVELPFEATLEKLSAVKVDEGSYLSASYQDDYDYDVEGDYDDGYDCDQEPAPVWMVIDLDDFDSSNTPQSVLVFFDIELGAQDFLVEALIVFSRYLRERAVGPSLFIRLDDKDDVGELERELLVFHDTFSGLEAIRENFTEICKDATELHVDLSEEQATIAAALCGIEKILSS